MTELRLPKSRGGKRALQICINYEGTKHRLQGCINDGNVMRDFLKSVGYTNITRMDDHSTGNMIPTRNNILRVLNELAAESHSHLYTNYFIQYSGHGAQLKDLDGDEKDGHDECLISIDMKPVVDDELNIILRKFAPWVTVFLFIDACHSGTMTDLVFHYITPLKVIQESDKTCNSQIVQISGCMDAETSADAWIREERKNFGAMTNSFMKNKGMQKNIFQILKDMHLDLRKNHYRQRPQLTASRLLPQGTKLENLI